ncbi:uncharacterized protein LOC120203881 [Hibiscus syriacus]|uniref:uncharacterized protein LOC120203881 n=1 Tax=Hibiscus syriacus TaxID=106335 RepID=UPI0019209CB7|nr:uncharacterized protein LOC120203881 [Hibiscus syriacus]
MAILGRLLIKDKLLQMGIVVGRNVFSVMNLEIRNHLLFECYFVQRIWKAILVTCNLHRAVMSWEEELEWASSHLKGKSLISFILRIARKAVAYCVWEQRNSRQFNNFTRD